MAAQGVGVEDDNRGPSHLYQSSFGQGIQLFAYCLRAAPNHIRKIPKRKGKIDP